VSAGGTDLGALISGGEQDVFGYASGAVVASGVQAVESGGTAINTVVSSGGVLELSTGAVATGFTIQSGGTLEAASGFTISAADETSLNSAIVLAHEVTSGSLTIEIDGAINLTSALEAINLQSGVTLTVSGASGALDGGGSQRGLFIYSGDVNIDSLTLQNLTAKGGNGGGDGGGGGAGLGGGLFIAGSGDPGQAVTPVVTLDNVSFLNDSAGGGGGGGIGGNGGFAGGPNSGTAGIIPGAPSGGHAAGSCGASGGGGGGNQSIKSGGGGGGIGGGNAPASPGNDGASGGFGGGGGGSDLTDGTAGGNGGFGGGGGGGTTNAVGPLLGPGNGGFGGGGGGGNFQPGVSGGSGGFGAGNGARDSAVNFNYPPAAAAVSAPAAPSSFSKAVH
jgi:hypothetical protein